MTYLEKGLTPEALHLLMHKLESKTYEAGQVICRELSLADRLLFVEVGVVEVYTECEGNVFVLDRLYSGSVINPRAFLLEDLLHVSIRCGAKEGCGVLELTLAAF